MRTASELFQFTQCKAISCLAHSTAIVISVQYSLFLHTLPNNRKFTFNDIFRDLIRNPGQSDEDLSISQLMLCGTASGMFQQTVTFPLEFVRTRLSLQESSSKLRYKGVVDCIRKTVSDEGVLALYKGLGPTMVSGSVYVGLQMTFYTRWKDILSDYISDEHKTIRKLMAGSLAGVCSQTMTYPGDTVRRRMIANGTGGTKKLYKNSWDCLKTMIRKEGMQGLFKGATANYIRCIPGAAIQFYAYDFFCQILGVYYVVEFLMRYRKKD